jgi:hypothetical protein
MTPPPKHKPRADWEVGEILEHQRGGAAPISDEWRQYVTELAEAGGIDPGDLDPDLEAGDPDESIEDMDMDRVVERVRRRL